MWSVLLSPAPADFDQVIYDLWERDTAGVLEEPEGLRAYFLLPGPASRTERDFASIARDLREELAPATLTPLDDWEPVLAGSRFVIVPKGFAAGADFAGRIVLEVNAGMAFGSGRHESTQLCLEALETLIKGGETVIDVGCGSGILSMAARKLGAGNVIACDIQEDAVRTARDHYKGPIFQGSADALKDSVADIVLTNISARINDRVAYDLHRITAPSGVLVISGFTTERVPKHFQPIHEWQRDTWLCWACGRSPLNYAQLPTEVNLHPADWWV